MLNPFSLVGEKLQTSVLVSALFTLTSSLNSLTANRKVNFVYSQFQLSLFKQTAVPPTMLTEKERQQYGSTDAWKMWTVQSDLFCKLSFDILIILKAPYI